MPRPLASIGDRFTAQFIDGFVAIAVGAAIFCAARTFGWPLGSAIFGWIAYTLARDALPGGRSVGKRLTGISVVHVGSERPCTVARSIARNMPMLVLGVVDAAFIVGRQRRRLGDFLAGTKVVDVAR